MEKLIRLNEFVFLEDLLISQTATEKGIDNTEINQKIFQNLYWLAEKIIKPVLKLKSNGIITSCFRCQKLNDLVGWSKTSQHLRGEAIDMVFTGESLESVFEFFKNTQLPYDQLILEKNNCLHFSYDRDKKQQRREALTYE